MPVTDVNAQTITIGDKRLILIDAGGRLLIGDLSDLDTTNKTDLVSAINEVLAGAGGGGGTSNYNDLTNKPQIAGTTLTGNKSLADLGIAAASDIPLVPVQSVNGQTGAVVLSIPSSAADVGAIAAPASPATGAFLVWSGSAWVAQTLSAWSGGSY